jgi:uncharacterized membrane protein
MKSKSIKKVGMISQVVGAFTSVTFVVLSFFGFVPQEMFMTTAGEVSLDLSTAPLKAIIIGAIGIVAVLSFLISFIAYKTSKKRKRK